MHSKGETERPGEGEGREEPPDLELLVYIGPVEDESHGGNEVESGAGTKEESGGEEDLGDHGQVTEPLLGGSSAVHCGWASHVVV